MKRRVLFVGAGFSKALCSDYPTLPQLSEAVSTSFLNRYPSGAIREHLNQLPPGLVANAEQLLSYLFSDWPWKSSVDRELDKALYKALTYEISNCLASIPAQPLTEENQQFIRFLGNTNNQIVSLNYDTLIQQLYGQYSLPKGEDYSKLRIHVEDIFDDETKTTPENPWLLEDVRGEDSVRMKLTFRRDFIQQITSAEFVKLIESTKCANWSAYAPDNLLPKYRRDDKLKQRSQILDENILKLHGSISWYEESTDSTIRIRDRDGNINWERIPIIVPPVLDKSQHYAIDRLRQQWANAHSALEQADEIVIIGFSFPPTDISCQFLFRSALKSRSKVRIVVVNIDHTIRERYDPIFRELVGVDLDYSYSGQNDVFGRYVRTEVLRLGKGG
nr:E391 [uncultured bacterium]